MGKIETQIRKNSRRANIKKIILETVAIAGILSIGLIAPNVLGAMNKLGILPSKRQKEIIKQSRNRLIQQGLLEYRDNMVHLTLKGEKTLNVLKTKEYKIEKPKRWDKKWRVIIFDIPEKRKRLREQIRKTLTTIGFRRLQDSVWIFPYDCEDLLTLLKANFHVGKDMLYMVVDQLEYDKPYKNYFKLE